ncbi:MAG: DMT family transporter [Planctomycetes bacterium]|nr:DMT family transporter [Planctomycetota bacterium]
MTQETPPGSQGSSDAPVVRSSALLVAGLLLAVTAVATGAVFARLSELPALSKAAWRCGLAALLLSGPALRSGGLRRLPPARTLAAGLLLGLHFGAWISSLDHTSVAVSVLLVNTTPLWVALLSRRVNAERVPAGARWGVALGFLGAAALPITEALRSGSEGARLTGSLLALLGALGWAGYTLAGRGVVRRVPLVAYLCACYGSAAAGLALVCACTGQLRAPASAAEWWPILGLALVPQLIGHSMLNWALQSLPAVVVSLAALGEPVLASVLAWVLLQEAPGLPVLLAAPLILTGVLSAARARPGS